MRLALLLAMISSAAEAQYPAHRVFRQRNLPAGTAPLFSFASLSLGSACACSAVTGLTTTRASTAYCTKADVDELANGDLVACGNNVPVVMPGGDGTGGVGVLVEGAETSVALRSEEADNATWTKIAGGGPAAPYLDGGTVVAPDGTTTAETILFDRVGEPSKYGLLRQGVTLAAAGQFCGYVKKESGGAKLWLNNGASVSNAATECAPVTTAWKRCCVSSTTSGAVNFDWGGNSYITAEGSAPMASAITVALWGMNAKSSTTAPSSYIKTVGASATRVASVVTASLTVPAASTFALKATYVAPSAFTATRTVAQVWWDANNSVEGYVTTTHATTSTFTCNFRIGGSDSTVASVATMTAGASNVVACYYDGTNKAACVDGTCNTSAVSLTLPNGAATLYVGGRQAGAGFEANGVIKGLCVDPTLSKCGVTP